MKLTEEQLKKYTCKLERKFFNDFINEYQRDTMDEWFYSNNYAMPHLYDSNSMLDFLFNYHEVNDKSKQYFYFMCMKTFGDVPPSLQRKYKNKFGLDNCGTEIYNSYACAHSNLLINCNDIKQSFGCDKCKFSHHLLYCSGQRHKSYMAFNKEVTKQRFNELTKMSPEQLQAAPEFNGGLYAKINSMIEYIYRIKDNGT